MAGVRSKPNGKRYQGWYRNVHGKRVWFAGTGDRRETLRMAQKLEDDAVQVRSGYRDPAKSYQRHRSKSITEAAAEYLEWGRAGGGIGGRPWGEHHDRKREFYLEFWIKTLK